MHRLPCEFSRENGPVTAHRKYPRKNSPVAHSIASDLFIVVLSFAMKSLYWTNQFIQLFLVATDME